MATITIRNLADDIRDSLRIQAAEHGRSMEAEIRLILKRNVEDWQAKKRPVRTGLELLNGIRESFGEEAMKAWEEVELPEREPMNEPRVNFDHPDYDPT